MYSLCLVRLSRILPFRLYWSFTLSFSRATQFIVFCPTKIRHFVNYFDILIRRFSTSGNGVSEKCARINGISSLSVFSFPGMFFGSFCEYAFISFYNFLVYTKVLHDVEFWIYFYLNSCLIRSNNTEIFNLIKIVKWTMIECHNESFENQTSFLLKCELSHFYLFYFLYWKLFFDLISSCWYCQVSEI